MKIVMVVVLVVLMAGSAIAGGPLTTIKRTTEDAAIEALRLVEDKVEPCQGWRACAKRVMERRAQDISIAIERGVKDITK
jgi:hypothetical protein